MLPGQSAADSLLRSVAFADVDPSGLVKASTPLETSDNFSAFIINFRSARH